MTAVAPDGRWQKTGRPVPFEVTEPGRDAVDGWIAGAGLDPATYGTPSPRRTKATIVYRKTGKLRAVQRLFGHTKIESTVRYLGVEVDDALGERLGGGLGLFGVEATFGRAATGAPPADVRASVLDGSGDGADVVRPRERSTAGERPQHAATTATEMVSCDPHRSAPFGAVM